MKFSGFNTTEKVGIANTAPAAKLHVGPAVYGPHSTISTIGIFADDVAGTAIPLTVSNANAVTVGDQARMSFSFSTGWSATSTIGAIIENTSTAATALSFETYKAGVGMIEAMRIQGDGKVGIGTTAPSSLLTLKSSVAGAVDIFAIKADDGGNLYRVGKDGNDHGYVELFDGASTPIKVRFNSAGDSYFNGGNFGIGTTSLYAGTNVTSLTINATSYPTISLNIGGTISHVIMGYSTSLNIDAIGNRSINLRTNDTDRLSN